MSPVAHESPRIDRSSAGGLTDGAVENRDSPIRWSEMADQSHNVAAPDSARVRSFAVEAGELPKNPGKRSLLGECPGVRHADPGTTMRSDQARQNLDRHRNYIIGASWTDEALSAGR
jgi:hypothetical protein